MKHAILLFIFYISFGLGQTIQINEIVSSNGDNLYDEDGDTPDWIEIYNSGSSSVDLSNWSLSDSENVPDKWKFPEGTVISPDRYLVILADELDDKISEAKYLHTNFKLSGDGEFLGLYDEKGNPTVSYTHLTLPTTPYV